MVIDDANVSVCNAMSESVSKHQSMHRSHAGGHAHDVYEKRPMMCMPVLRMTAHSYR